MIQLWRRVFWRYYPHMHSTCTGLWCIRKKKLFSKVDNLIAGVGYIPFNLIYGSWAVTFNTEETIGHYEHVRDRLSRLVNGK